jgi:hypothetical protein
MEIPWRVAKLSEGMSVCLFLAPFKNRPENLNKSSTNSLSDYFRNLSTNPSCMRIRLPSRVFLTENGSSVAKLSRLGFTFAGPGINVMDLGQVYRRFASEA